MPRGCAVAGALAAALAGLAACGSGAPRPTPSPVLSNYERATGDTIHRDCGYSSPLPGRPGWSIWLFCDTEVTNVHGQRIGPLILGTGTAAAGPYQAGRPPSPLSEIPTPPGPLTLPSAGAPQPFLPQPQSLQLSGSLLPCAGAGAYPAEWISGVTGTPPAATPGALLISYDDYCVTGTQDAPTAEGFGLAVYYPAAGLICPALVFSGAFGPLPQQQILGSPVVGRDGYLYLFGLSASGVFAVRTLAAPAYWRNPFSYHYWTGAGWSAQPAAAGSLLPPGTRPLGISVGDYDAAGHGMVMIEQTSLAGGFQVWQADSPAGPWRRILTGQVPCADGTGSGTEALCRAIIGHPELSTRGRLLISYFDPGNEHVDVSAYPWL